MKHQTIFPLIAAAALITAAPLRAQNATPPEQRSPVAEAAPPDMATFVARVRKGMTGGKGSAQARKAKVRQIALEHAESRRRQGSSSRQGSPSQQESPSQQQRPPAQQQ